MIVLNQKWVKVQIPQKAQLDPLGVLCVKYEDNRTSTFRDMLRKRIVHGRLNGPTAQRCNIIIFSSATLCIEFRLKIFQPVHYPPGSNPLTKNCYPSLFSYKVIGKRRGKKTEAESIAPSVSPTVTAGAKKKAIW